MWNVELKWETENIIQVVFCWIAVLVLGITLLSLCNRLLPHESDAPAPYRYGEREKDSSSEYIAMKFHSYTQTPNKLHYQFQFPCAMDTYFIVSIQDHARLNNCFTCKMQHYSIRTVQNEGFFVKWIVHTVFIVYMILTSTLYTNQ